MRNEEEAGCRPCHKSCPTPATLASPASARGTHHSSVSAWMSRQSTTHELTHTSMVTEMEAAWPGDTSQRPWVLSVVCFETGASQAAQVALVLLLLLPQLPKGQGYRKGSTMSSRLFPFETGSHVAQPGQG